MTIDAMSEGQPAPEEPKASLSGGIAARGAQIGVMFVLLGVVAFGAAGTLEWGWAWLWLAIYLGSTLVNAWFLMRRSPELVAERGRPGGAARRWDAVVSGVWALAQFVALPLVAGLDVRFGWTGPIGVGWHIAGAVLFAVGLGVFGWGMVANAYFSTAARIQDDRGQTVCRTGPYRFVRHPGYAASILQGVGSALLLGSVWALVPAVIAAGAIVERTRLEDRMLHAELPGYTTYAADVRYRLLPGVW